MLRYRCVCPFTAEALPACVAHLRACSSVLPEIRASAARCMLGSPAPPPPAAEQLVFLPPHPSEGRAPERPPELAAKLQNARLVGDRWEGSCPVPEHGGDMHPSLSWRDADDRILLYCHRRCPPEAIVAALGITMSDLFLRPAPHDSGPAAGIIHSYDYRDLTGCVSSPRGAPSAGPMDGGTGSGT
jgi:hypothetical protein